MKWEKTVISVTTYPFVNLIYNLLLFIIYESLFVIKIDFFFCYLLFFIFPHLSISKNERFCFILSKVKFLCFIFSMWRIIIKERLFCQKKNEYKNLIIDKIKRNPSHLLNTKIKINFWIYNIIMKTKPYPSINAISNMNIKCYFELKNKNYKPETKNKTLKNKRSYCW